MRKEDLYLPSFFKVKPFTKMNKILIALDYNPTAQKVAETGYNMAKAMNAEVCLIHVMADPTYYYSRQYTPIMGFDSFSNAELLNSITVDELRNAAQDFLDKSKQHLGDESIITILEEGDAASNILETAKEQQADIIVMGTHSRRGLDKILMGSVAESVLHQSPVPLFIIPTREEKKD